MRRRMLYGALILGLICLGIASADIRFGQPGGGGPGTGTQNRLAYWATTTMLGDSRLSDDGSNITLTSGKLTGTGQTVTTSQPILDLSQTWNSGGVTFNAVKVNITDTASAAASLFIDLQVGSATKFNVDKVGSVTITGLSTFSPLYQVKNDAGVISSFSTGRTGFLQFSGKTLIANSGNNSVVINTSGGIDSNGPIGLNANSGGTPADVLLYRDAASILAQRNGANAQTFRVYGTFTDLSNRVNAALSATSTVVTLAAETAGTGADDVSINLDPAGTGTIQVDGVNGVSGASCTTVAVTKGIVTGCTP